MTDQPLLPRRIAWSAPWTWKRRTQIIAGLLVLMSLVAYPLSFGPAWQLEKAGWISEDLFTTIYYPILSLYERNDLVPFLNWYLWLFGEP